MEPIRCALANLPKKMLADILESVAGSSSEFKVVKKTGAVDDFDKLFTNNEEENIEIAVVGMNSAEFNQSFFNLFDSKKDISVITVIDGGKHMAAFLNNFGKADLLQAMRLLSRSKNNSEAKQSISS